MPTPTNIQAELDRHREQNRVRMQEMVDDQFNTEITRSFKLTFISGTRSDADGLGRLLFAKGMRLVTLQPQQLDSGEFCVQATVKHSLREITQEDFICDLINVACGVNAVYQDWELLSEESAEQTQPHNSTPDIQQ